MATADQIKALLDSFVDGDEQRFFSIAMQVAASEARSGHGKLADEIRTKIDEAKRQRGLRPPVPIGRPRGELASVLSVSYPKARMNDMVLAEELATQIQRIIREQRHAGKILERGLSPRRKLLLVGPPGTGKTLTASVLASELGIPLLQVRLDGVITRFMGETASKLRQIFESTHQMRGVYFFDEFDAIGSQRALSNDVGEMRRVLNSFLMMLEQDVSHSLIMAATNHPDLLDPALFRRFDDVLHYDLPTPQQVGVLLKSRLATHVRKGTSWRRLGELAAGLSYGEIAKAAEEVLKDALIHNKEPISEVDIRVAIDERQQIRQKWGRPQARLGK